MLIRLENIGKTYREGGLSLEALRDVDLSIEEGECVAIMGASGSGKSTLLNILGGMDKASRGKYYLEGEEIIHRFMTLHAQGKTVIIVTHDEMVAKHCGRVIRIVDGRVEG